MIGDPVRPLDEHPDVIRTGFVSEELKESALSGALALAQPSYFESFSMILTEAWAHAKPALVQGYCDVLAGQCRRSGGGIPYKGFAEFGVALDLLLADEASQRIVQGIADAAEILTPEQRTALIARMDRRHRWRED